MLASTEAQVVTSRWSSSTVYQSFAILAALAPSAVTADMSKIFIRFWKTNIAFGLRCLALQVNVNECKDKVV